jgi:hypothetical protein
MTLALRARVVPVIGIVSVALVLTGCSSGVEVGPSSPTQPPTAPSPPAPGPPGTTITVTSSGVSPQELTVAVGSRVTFTNADTRPHDFSGGPDPSQPECPEIDAAGFVAPGQSRQTGVFTTARTCRFHDHTFIGVPAFQGRIVIE